MALIIEAVKQAIHSGGRRVVYCFRCKTARLDGPEYCPNCGGPLTAPPSKEASSPNAAMVDDDTEVEASKVLSTAVATVPASPVLSTAPRRRGAPAKLYAFRGEMLTLEAIAERAGNGLCVDTLRIRLKCGWSLERAVTEKVHTKRVTQQPRQQAQEAIVLQPEIQQEANTAVAVVEKRLIMADNTASVDVSSTDELPASVKLIRERCQRLDEIDYEISLLRVERKQIAEKLVKGEV